MSKEETKQKVISRNRKARADYSIENTFEVGIVLHGTEVKSVRQGRANIKDAYAKVIDGELFLIGLHIAAYDQASHFNHEPLRQRKLLEKKRTILKLSAKINERGYTLVPLELYIKDGYVKVLLGLGKGRKHYDRRRQIKEKDDKRQARNEQ